VTSYPTVATDTVELGPDGERRVVHHHVGQAPDTVSRPRVTP